MTVRPDTNSALQPENKQSAAGAAVKVRSESVVRLVALWVTTGILVATLLDGSMQFLATRAAIFALFALSVNILFGWSGVASFGQAAFFGIGAYSFALMAPHIPSLALVMLIGSLLAGATAGVFAMVPARVRGVEFAMLTLMLAQIAWLLTFRISALRGEDGIPGVPRVAPFGTNAFDEDVFWWVVVVVVSVATYLLLRVANSSLGYAMNAVRDDPVRAAAAGIDVKWTRVIAFTLAGCFAGLAGSLFAQHQGLVSPSTLHWELSGQVIVMCLIGGLHRFWGPVLGAVAWTALDWYLFANVSAPLLYIGVVLLIVVLAFPQGLIGLFKVVDVLRRRLKVHSA